MAMRSAVRTLAVVAFAVWGGAAFAQALSHAAYGVCDCEDGKAGQPCPVKCKEPPKERYKIYFTGAPPSGTPPLPPLATIVPEGSSVATRIVEAVRRSAEVARLHAEKERIVSEEQRAKGDISIGDYKARIEKYNQSIGGYRSAMKDLKALKGDAGG